MSLKIEKLIELRTLRKTVQDATHRRSSVTAEIVKLNREDIKLSHKIDQLNRRINHLLSDHHRHVPGPH